MTAAALTPEQVTALVEGMRARGLRLGVDAHLRAQRVLRLCEGFSRERLTVALRAVLATGEERDDVFRDALAMITEPPREAPPPPPTALPEATQRAPRRVASTVGALTSVAVALSAPAWAHLVDAGATVWPWASVAGGLLASGAVLWRTFGNTVVGRIDAVAPGTTAFTGAVGTAEAPPVHGPWVLEVNVPRGQRTPWWARDAVHRTAAAFVRAAHCFDEGRVSVPASITATVRAGGLPVLVRGLVPRVPEVSFVIDAGAGSHEGVAPYVELAERLQRSGARVATHRFAGTPARVRRAGGRAARSLASLRARTDLLVMVGDGAMGVDEATRGPASWLRTLRAFPERVWLNPLPQSRWSPGAHAVARATKILAPSSRCFEALAHTRAPRQGGEVSPWFAFAAGGDANALDALHLYLGPTAFRALCCAAVADKPEAQIALALARAARVRLRLEERLRLVTLPCFADGSWPEGLRGRLLDRLEAEQLHAATAAWEALLDAAKPREGSVARHDWSAARVDLDAVKERGRIGWHGEKMPVGMMRAEEQGRYRWQGERAVNIPMVYIPPGTFIRGSDDGDSDEKPQHRCTITKGYYVGLYPVTLAEYARFLAATPEHAQYGGGNASFAQGDDHPAVNVSWRDAQAYCCWAGVRLLTEAEWEYAARGSDGRAYPWGNEAPSKENPMLDHLWWSSHGTSAAGETRAVDQSIRGASPFGALEMSGNVWEWVEDVYGAYPEDGEQYDPIASLPLDSDSSRVLRGGSWYVGASSRLSATSRERYGPSNRDVLIGFRVARGYVDIARGPHP